LLLPVPFLPHKKALLNPLPSSDHFDAQVEASLRRDLPIITTPHAKSHLASSSSNPSEAFTAVHDLDFFDDALVDIKGSTKGGKQAAIKVTGMPGKHVPPGPGGMMGKMNDLLAAVSIVLLFLWG